MEKPGCEATSDREGCLLRQLLNRILIIRLSLSEKTGL